MSEPRRGKTHSSGTASGSGGTSTSLKIKIRPRAGAKPANEIKVRHTKEGQVEQHFAREGDGAIQIVRVDGVIVHIDCKAPGCGNSWTKELGLPRDDYFTVETHGWRAVDVACLGCRRRYEDV